MKSIFWVSLFCFIIFLISFNSISEMLKQPDIVVGTSQDLSRSLERQCRLIVDAMKIIFNRENKAGGIRGRALRLEPLDDKYDPDQARKNIERFLTEFNTDITLGSLGSSNLAKYIDLVKDKKVLVLFPNTGIFRDPELTHLIHFRASCFESGFLLVNYMLEKTNAKRFVFFYQDDSFGKGVLEGACAALKKAGINNWVEVSHRRNYVSLSSQVKKIKEANYDAIGFFSVPAAAKSLIGGIGAYDLLNKKLFGVELSEETFTKYVKEKIGLKFVNANMVPNPKSSELEIVKEFREDAKEYHLDEDPWALEGYINASIFVDVLKKIKGPITKEKIIDAMEKIKNYNFKGLMLNFNPATRSLSDTIWLDICKEKWIPIKRKKQEVKNQKNNSDKDFTPQG